MLYSFTRADQEQHFDIGIDTATEEGRKRFEEDYNALCELMPELMKKEQIIYPHEMKKEIPTEAHFQRVWRFYREHKLRGLISDGVAQGKVTDADAAAALSFLSEKHHHILTKKHVKGQKHHISVRAYVNCKQGLRPDLENNEGFLAADRVFNQIGVDTEVTKLSAQDFAFQFWDSFSKRFNLTEDDMRSELKNIMSADPSTAKLLEQGETTKHLEA